jgi:hypothetical protein
MAERRFLCYVEGIGDKWEAISVDFDIAVSGCSLDEIKTILTSAILTYIEDANKEEERARKRLLSRRMPRRVQFAWILKIIAHELFRSTSNNAGALFEGRYEFSCQA